MKKYYNSGKPALYSKGHPEMTSVVASPARYRAPENPAPKETMGKRLIRRRGYSTLATKVVTTYKTDTR